MASTNIGPIRRIPASERVRVEELLERARLQVRDFVTTLNTTNLAVMLPAELLVHIFKYTIAAWPRRHEVDPWTGLDLVDSDVGQHRWFYISHVCVRWRDVALSTPSLWTKIWVVRPYVVQMLLKRSGKLPLDVEGLIPQRVPDRLAEILLSVFAQAHRIRSLKLHCLFDDLEDTTGWLIDARPDFSNVKALFISRDEDSAYEQKLPPFFEPFYHTSSLNMLRLHNVSFEATVKLSISRVQHLEFRGLMQIERKTGPEEWLSFLTLLKGLPELKTLRLTDSLPFRTAEFRDLSTAAFEDLPLILDTPLDLPHLTLLQASSQPCEPVFTFVRNVTLPPSAVLRLEMEMDDEGGDRLLGELLAIKLAAAREAVPSQLLRTLAIYTFHDSTSLGIVSVAGWSEKQPRLTEPLLPTYPTTSTPDPCLFEVTSRVNAEGLVIMETIPLLPLETVEYLFLGIDRPRNEANIVLSRADILVTSLERATNVETLIIQGDWAVPFADALRPEDDGSMLFPNLKTLHLETNFPPEGNTWDFEDVAQVREDFLRTLTASICARAKHGRRLEMIYVKRSADVSAEDVEILKPYAGDIVHDNWDASRVRDTW